LVGPQEEHLACKNAPLLYGGRTSNGNWLTKGYLENWPPAVNVTAMLCASVYIHCCRLCINWTTLCKWKMSFANRKMWRS